MQFRFFFVLLVLPQQPDFESLIKSLCWQIDSIRFYRMTMFQEEMSIFCNEIAYSYIGDSKQESLCEGMF